VDSVVRHPLRFEEALSMTALWSELRFGLRALRRHPGFAAAAVLSLVLGIGTNTGVFSLLYSLYLRPLPVEHLDRLVAVYQSWRTESGDFVGEESLAYDNYLDYRAKSRTLEDLALHLQSPMSLTGGDVAEQIVGIYTTANYFDLLGLKVSRGRFFTPEEASLPEGRPVVVLSYGCWSRLFARDPNIVGRTVRINGVEHTIVGVGPEGFRGTELWVNADLWLPVPRFRILHPYRDLFEYRDGSVFRAVGRLAPGATRQQVEAELTAMSAEISETYFQPPDFMKAVVRPFRETLLPSRERHRFLGLGWTLIVGVAVILLIACLNVATLTLVRGLERDREIAVRQAIGAGRPSVVRQLVVESLVVFVVGAALSLPVAWLTLRLLWRYRPPQFAENAVDLSLHPVALLFALGVALVTGVVFGLLPALRVSRVDLVHSLKEGATRAPTGEWLGFDLHPRSLLVTLQVALALVALVGAGLLYRSVANLRSTDLGFDPDNLALMRISPGEQGMDEAHGRDLYRRVLERLEALPGVESVALSENRLLRGATAKQAVFVEGESHAAISPLGDLHRTNSVSPGFFRTVGIPLVKGEDFSDSIRPDGPPVVIINEYMAETLWPGENAVGKRFRFHHPTPPDPLVEVIGIAANARYRDLHEGPQFFLYRPLSQRYSETVTVHVRTTGDPGRMLPVLRREIRRVEPNLVVSDVRTMDYYLGTAMWIERLSMISFGAFGTLALALAVVGVYGVVSFTVRRMWRDLGIRRALGARSSRLLSRVLREALVVVGAGVILGWVLAYFALRPFIEGFLVDVRGGDPAVYAAGTLVLLVLTLASTLWPAWRSLRVEPMAVLREE
jgi:macrolide transport system ATP-binding/permease protein